MTFTSSEKRVNNTGITIWIDWSQSVTNFLSFRICFFIRMHGLIRYSTFIIYICRQNDLLMLVYYLSLICLLNNCGAEYLPISFPIHFLFLSVSVIFSLVIWCFANSHVCDFRFISCLAEEVNRFISERGWWWILSKKSNLLISKGINFITGTYFFILIFI